MASFTMPDTICTGQVIPIVNTSQGASSYEWTLCEPPWKTNPTLTALAFPSLGWIQSACFGQQNGNHFAFVLYGAGSRSLARIDFGNSFSNSIAGITPLGDFSGAIDVNAGKNNMHLLEDNGNWYLFIAGIKTTPSTISYPLVRLSFGNSLTNTTPALQDLTGVAGFSGPEDMAFVKQGNEWLAFVVNSSISGYLSRLSFGNSLANTPVSTNMGNFGGLLLNPSRIQLLTDKGSWFALVSEPVFGRVIRLSFGTNLLNTPVASLVPIAQGMFDAVYARGCNNEVYGISYNSLILQRFNVAVYSGQMGFIQTLPFNIRSIVPNTRILKPVTDWRGGYVFFTRNALLLFPPQNGDTLFVLQFKTCEAGTVPTPFAAYPGAFTFSQPGEYTVRLTINKGMATEETVCKKIVVRDGISGSSVTKTILCSNSNVQLRPSNPQLIWQWNTGEQDSVITVNKPGWYWARFQSGCGTRVDSFEVTAVGFPTTKVAQIGLQACTQDSILLRATGALRYSWFPNEGLNASTGAVVLAFPANGKKYVVRGEDANGCSSLDSIVLKADDKRDSALYLLPNAFTPNGDGKNDCFGIPNWGRLQRVSFRVFDRWGKVVFYTSESTRCWDGRYASGQPATAGTYTYLVEATNACGNIKRSGTVTLIR